MSERNIKDSPFVYQSVNALKAIKEYCLENNAVRDFAGIRNIYLAICELASKQKKDSFETYVSSIATYALTTDKTTSKHLKVLRQLELVSFEDQKQDNSGKFLKLNITILRKNHRGKLLPTAKDKQECEEIESPSEIISTRRRNDFSATTDINNPLLEPSLNNPNINITPEQSSADIFSYEKFLEMFNTKTEKKFRGDKKSKAQFKARVKDDKATKEDFEHIVDMAVTKLMGTDYEHNLTPELVTRVDKFQKYLNSNSKKAVTKVETTQFQKDYAAARERINKRRQ